MAIRPAKNIELTSFNIIIIIICIINISIIARVRGIKIFSETVMLQIAEYASSKAIHITFRLMADTSTTKDYASILSPNPHNVPLGYLTLRCTQGES